MASPLVCFCALVCCQMSDHSRLLVVEDNADARSILSAILTQRGFDVLMAPDARSGVAVGMCNEFDLLLCDIGLPDGDGNDVLKELRHEKDFPAIAFTALTTLGDIERQMDAGFDLHVSKPFHITDLMDAINKLLIVKPTHVNA
jgi:DNA-binding response OmpR family regulator